MRTEANLYTIGEVSQLCGIPIKTLRYYDDVGLLKPLRRDAENNYRYYSQKELLEIIAIKELRSLSWSLNEIKIAITQKDLTLLCRQLDDKLQQIDANIEELSKRAKALINNRNRVTNGLNILQSYKAAREGRDAPSRHYNIETIITPRARVVYTRYNSRCNVNELFLERHAELLKIKEHYHLHSCGPLIAVFHTHYATQFFENIGDLELCLPVIEEECNCSNTREFGGFLGVTTIHVGKYKDMYPGYLALIEWAKNNDFILAGPAIEQYIIGPADGCEENYVTRITLPGRYGST